MRLALVNEPAGEFAQRDQGRLAKHVCQCPPENVSRIDTSSFSSADELVGIDVHKANLVGFFDDPDFTSTFRHYMRAAQWTQRDLSSTKPTALSPRAR